MPTNEPYQELRTRPDIRIGLPVLPRAGSSTHFEILRQWIQDCERHPVCRLNTPETCLPTRLIDVGLNGRDTVRLWETSPDSGAEYIALSHPWGNGPHFVTLPSNLDQHKAGMRIDELPATFRDAVTVTRALNKRYLWIDSICIIQGPDGDFHEQAKKMETVFSSAYCVIAASRAHSQNDGFLQSRPPPRNVEIQLDGADTPVYISEFIDDFSHHVLNGHLNKRGWVLQEHALARRTIFFTDRQTYWECGDGVRCETLSRLQNNLAAFLGDPNFPRLIMAAGVSQGEKIIRFQNLYKTYSSLLLTNPVDRPIAIDGMQTRLLRAFATSGGFGVFDGDKVGQGGLLRRSLLWYRPPHESLTRIEFPAGRNSTTAVPSWSWMAYMGEIDYLQPTFGSTDWENIRSPWSRVGQTLRATTDGRSENVALSGEARAITLDIADAEMSGKLYFDMPGGSARPALECVVLGTERSERPQPLSARLHYFILVAPTTMLDLDGTKIYRRTGAGYLPGRMISAKKSWVKIR